MPKRTYSPGEIAWLAEGYKHWRAKELAERYQARFGRPIDHRSIHRLLNRRGHRSGRPPGFARGERLITWTREKIAWLGRVRPHNTLADTTRQFNGYWGLDCSRYAIDGVCQRNGIQRGEPTTFAPGTVPWNKGRRGYQAGGRSAESWFKAGGSPWTTQPVGAYRRDAEGYWWLKVSDGEHAPGRSRTNWREVHRLTWEAAQGPQPSGHAVVFLDGDPDHCLDAANLACVSRAVLARLNQMGWGLVRDTAARRALIALAELQTQAHAKARQAGMNRRETQAALPAVGRTCPPTSP